MNGDQVVFMCWVCGHKNYMCNGRVSQFEYAFVQIIPSFCLHSLNVMIRIRFFGGRGFKTALQNFVLAHLILEIHYCALRTVPLKFSFTLCLIGGQV